MEDSKILSVARHYLGSLELMDEVTEEKLNNMLQDLKTSITPLHIYNIYEVSLEENFVIFKNTIFKVKSKDLSELLSASGHCILIACTLGSLVENKLRRYSGSNISDGIIFDSLAAAYIEEYLNELNENFKNKYPYLTMRYSPGYGDLQLDVQPKILDLLQAQKKIGLTTNENHLLIPRKSITAFIGIQNTPWISEKKLCDTCKLYDTCNLRKEGKFCGIKKSIK